VAIPVMVLACLAIAFGTAAAGAQEKTNTESPPAGKSQPDQPPVPQSPPPPDKPVPPGDPSAAADKEKEVRVKAATHLLEAVKVKMLSEKSASLFTGAIKAGTPMKELLPKPPKVQAFVGPVLDDDLARVAEIAFGEAPDRKLSPDKVRQDLARQVAKINHLNQEKRDGYMAALLDARPDLTGLAWAMGDACRLKEERSRQFKIALTLLRNAQGATPEIKAAFAKAAIEDLLVQASEAKGAAQPPGGGSSGGAPGNGPPGGVAPGVSGTPLAGDIADQLVGTKSGAGNQPAAAESFWEQFLGLCRQDDKANATGDKARQEHVTVARVAALMQVLAPESAAHRRGLVKYLAGVAHVEATRALARLVLFTAEPDVREAAIDALKVRREQDYTGLLFSGLRYPWPAVARRAAEALVKLGRADLIPQLVDLLEAPDPRAPVLTEVDHQPVPVVRELVKVNHHRNCLLCHPPGLESIPRAGLKSKVELLADLPDHVVTGAIPIQGEALAPPSQAYQAQPQDLIVRVDATYLRQDFSMLLEVADAHPWPGMQRFDFLVRTRVLTDEEATAYRAKLQKQGPGAVTPYERAILAALRELTGLDTGPTAPAWRKLLNLPATKQPAS
jgi:hypothetical protein